MKSTFPLVVNGQRQCVKRTKQRVDKTVKNKLETGEKLVKQSIRPMTREETIRMRREGRKTVSHGSYRAKRKPNSPKVRNASK